jgi:hypothetical protein
MKVDVQLTMREIEYKINQMFESGIACAARYSKIKHPTTT